MGRRRRYRSFSYYPRYPRYPRRRYNRSRASYPSSHAPASTQGVACAITLLLLFGLPTLILVPVLFTLLPIRQHLRSLVQSPQVLALGVLLLVLVVGLIAAGVTRQRRRTREQVHQWNIQTQIQAHHAMQWQSTQVVDQGRQRATGAQTANHGAEHRQDRQSLDRYWHEGHFERAQTLDQLLALSPTAFEYFVADLLRASGYVEVRRTGGAGDLGADVMCSTADGRFIVVQCKRHGRRNYIDSPAIQTFIGMITVHHRAQGGIFVTTSY